jgi:hypothetical protein
MQWIETNGVVLRYELSGDGQTPLLLIHELGGSLEFWDPVLAAFQTDFQVLRFDLRGFGMSEKVKVLRLDDLLDDIAGLLEALAITDPCHVVSHWALRRSIRTACIAWWSAARPPVSPPNVDRSPYNGPKRSCVTVCVHLLNRASPDPIRIASGVTGNPSNSIGCAG